MGEQRDVDVAIIGGGPSGLAAALCCQEKGLRFVLFERGPSSGLRNRDNQSDIASGIGGAGLFSDGKFSFYPSATDLWRLGPISELREAYEKICDLLARYNLRSPPFPTGIQDITNQGNFVEKLYLSKYKS